MYMTDLKTITASLRAAVDGGDLGAIANGVSALERLLKVVPDDSCRITRLLRRGDDLGPVTTVGDILNAGSNWLRRHVFDDPDVFFQVEGDDRWYEATALFVMEEASPDLVREFFEDEFQEGRNAMKTMTLSFRQ